MEHEPTSYPISPSIKTTSSAPTSSARRPRKDGRRPRRRAGRAVKRFFTTLDNGYAAELDRRAIEADAFLRRSVR